MSRAISKSPNFSSVMRMPPLPGMSWLPMSAVGGVLVLALLAYMLFRKRTGRRFSFSLRWLVAFCFSCGFIVWGGVRWYQANVQSKSYETAMALYATIGDVDKPAHP